MALLGARLEAEARQAAFHYLDGLLLERSELTRAQLEAFEFRGRPLKLIDSSRGIRNPAEFTATLSVMTGLGSPYADEPVVGGLMRYDYRAGDGGDNVKLREAARQRVPIIYFRAVRPAVFVASYPAWVTDMPDRRCVLLAIGTEVEVLGDPASMTEAQRSYAERITRQRLHQPLFRARVMHAYEQRCAVCSLQHPDLLDAAHIIPDHDDEGQPIVTNGLALCKIHHAAYDRNLLGLRPDYIVQINERLMVEVDGPMLRHGLQEMHGRRIFVPSSRRERPDAASLSSRWSEFAGNASARRSDRERLRIRLCRRGQLTGSTSSPTKT